MSRRDPKLAALLKRAQADAPLPSDEDPFAGVPPDLALAHLYATTSAQHYTNGWDGMNAGRIKIHGDGHGTSHTGACAIPIAEDPIARLIRQAGLDHLEADLARDLAQHFGDSLPARAGRLGWPERTARRRLARIARKLSEAGYSERHLEGA